MTITIKGLWQYDGLVKDHEAALREAEEHERSLLATIERQKDTIVEQMTRIQRQRKNEEGFRAENADLREKVGWLHEEVDKLMKEIKRLEKKVREGPSYYDYTTGMWHTPGLIFNIETGKLEDCPPEGVPARRIL